MKHSLNLGVGEVRRGEATSYSVAEAGAAGSASSVAVAVAPVWTVAGISLGLTLLTLLALFWDTANSAVQTWLGDRTYGHGFLIVPIVGYLIWRRRSELLRLAPAPWPWGLAAMAMAVLLWLIGYISSVQVLQQLAFIAMVQSAVITVLGPAVFAALLFPMFMLVFAVPFGNFLIEPLQILTATMVVPLVRLSGAPVFIEGLYLFIPQGVFEVAEACSGIRFLISTVVLGLLLAHLLYRDILGRTLIIIAAAIIPIVANGLRAYGIVMIGFWAGMEQASGTDHIVYGFLFFSFVTGCLLMVAFWFRDRGANDREEPPPYQPDTKPRAARSRFVIAGLALVGLAATAPIYATPPQLSTDDTLALRAPQVGAPWRTAEETDAAWQLAFKGADAHLQQDYERDGQRLKFRAAYFRQQRQGVEVVNDQNGLGLPIASRALGTGRIAIELPGHPLRARFERRTEPGGDYLVVYWYWIGDTFTADAFTAKWLEFTATLLGGNPAAAVIAIEVPIFDSHSAAVDLLQDFLAHSEPIGALLTHAASDAGAAP